MQETVLYEFPLNERMRNFLRLESYFTQINYFLNNGDLWDSQASLLALIEILNILERNDIRSELTKELERNIATLSALADAPEINGPALQQILEELHTQLHAIQYVPSKTPASLRENDLLNAIKQRITVSSSINSFDVPGFYYWLNQPKMVRQQQFKEWMAELSTLENGVTLLNNLLRDSTMFETKIAESGFYQKSLNPQQACQMVRIAIPATENYFPEASGSKHRVSIRFLSYEAINKRPNQVTENVNFAVAYC